MSTIAGELSALSTAYGDRLLSPLRARRRRAIAHFLRCRAWRRGSGACSPASSRCGRRELGSLIEVVNRFGSFFYGSILGVFILAVGFPRATANGAFVGLLAGMACVGLAASDTKVAFLWHNVDRRRGAS